MSYWAISLSIIAIFLASPARAGRVECNIVVDGHDVLTGPCERRFNGRTILFVAVPGSKFDPAVKELIIYLHGVDTARHDIIPRRGRDVVLWVMTETGPRSEELGRVNARIRDGKLDGCWESERVLICASELHEHAE